MLNSVGVVGANGFIGKELVKHFTGLDLNVYAFDRNRPLVLDGKISREALKVKTFVWCASLVNPITATSHSDLVDAELAMWCEFLALVRGSTLSNSKIIFLSSGGCTYSGTQLAYSESDTALGTNEYGKLKLRMESEILKSQINHLILRVSNVYGPNQPSGRGQGVIAEWVNAIKNDRPMILFGDRNSFRDYIYIDDLTEAIGLLVLTDTVNQVFNVGTGVGTTLLQLENHFSNLTGAQKRSLNFKARNSDRLGYTLDITKISKELGWIPKYSIEEGLNSCLN